MLLFVCNGTLVIVDYGECQLNSGTYEDIQPYGNGKSMMWSSKLFPSNKWVHVVVAMSFEKFCKYESVWLLEKPHNILFAFLLFEGSYVLCQCTKENKRNQIVC